MTAPRPPADPTFRSYTSAQAKAYSASRTGYANALLDFVLSQHLSRGGDTELLLDVGCGTGQVARSLGKSFDSVVGVDPGRQMIETAQAAGGETAAGKPVEFRVCAAEDLDKLEGLEPESVDLLAAGMAAHWFDMPKFWAAAATVLKPGGSVALWTHASLYCHPSTRNHAEIQRILSHLEDVTLAPHVLEPNRMSRSLYATLPLPWTCEPPVLGFDPSSFLRREWDVDGVLTDGVDFFGGSDESTLEGLANALGTASMVTRWREANPELVGTENDCVAVAVKGLKEAMGGEGVHDAELKLRTGASTVVLFVTKSVS